MILKIRHIQNKIDAMSQRERALIFMALVILCYLLWSHFFYSPMISEKQQIKQQLEKAEQNFSKFSNQLQSFNSSNITSPAKNKTAEILRLNQAIKLSANQLTTLEQNILEFEQVPKMLEQVLTKIKSMTFLNTKTLPIEIVVFNSNSDALQNSANALTAKALYKHRIEVSWEGSYLETIKYLQSLQKLPWNFFWEDINYQVSDFPKAKVKLVIYTLSYDKGVIQT